MKETGHTPLDADEFDGLLHPHITTRQELNHLEQANVQEGLQWLAKTHRKDIVSEPFLCQLHEKMFGQVWDWAGDYRLSNKNIGVDRLRIYREMRKLFDDTHYWIDNDTYPAREIAVRFHHRLVWIHPFPNGNGRAARVMADAILRRVFDAPAIDWAGGHAVHDMEPRRTEYIEALRAADQGDFAPLFKFCGVGAD